MKASRYVELFHENSVLTMSQLMLETGQPRESILRDLKGIGYYTSYNARGKFYTLGEIPSFDGDGLWKYKCACFSARRTVLNTAEYLVEASEAGYTHEDLRRMLGIGIQNSLRQLAEAGRLERRQVGSQYVYFGKERYGEQWEKRSAMPIELAKRKKAKAIAARDCPGVESALVIDILVAALRGYDTEQAAASYLRQTGSKATANQVMAVFRHYSIGKKNPTETKRG